MNETNPTPNPSPVPPQIPAGAPPSSYPPRLALGEIPEEREGIRGFAAAIESILRQPRRVMFQLRQPGGGRLIAAMLFIAVVCSLIYGVIVGSFSGGVQWWAAPLKISAGLLISALICLPSLYIFACLGGSKARLVEIFGMVAGLLMLMTILLIGFAPVAWLFSQSTESLPWMGFLHLLFWFIATMFGVRFLSAAFAHSNARSSAGLVTWVIIFILVMLQMSTALRPIVGTADTLFPAEKKFFLSHWFDSIDKAGQKIALERLNRDNNFAVVIPMRLLKLLLKPETFAPVLAMGFATVISSALVVIQVLAAENLRVGLQRHGYLVWNLFLAWVPLVFALLVCEQIRATNARHWRLIVSIGGWLVFFPNAPYIFTDLVHISAATSRHYWADLAMILACALTGLLLWFVSLYLMQGLVARKFGSRAGWGFVTLMAGLTSFGIYLGRFHRFNSWDVVTKPSEVYVGLSSWAAGARFYQPTVTFPMLFTVFLFVAYLMLYALTHLSPARPAVVSSPDEVSK